MAKIQINNPRQIINGGAKKYYFKVKGLGGPKGDKGDKGDTGSQGPQGPQGNAATVSVGSTTTLPVGYDATVTNTGSIYNAVLDFGIPQGPQGPQGAKGDKGDTGAQGETGPRGPQGEKGTNATVYVGTTTTTNPGTQARVYNSGTDSNAVLNFEIPRGDVGPQPELVQTTGTSTTKAMSQNATTNALATKQNTIDSSHKISADLVTDTSTTNKFVTAEDKTTWNAKQNTLTAGQGIDITSDVISTPALVPEVVASLPAEGTEGKLYLTPKNYTRSTATGNPITATITDGAGSMESFQLDGDTFQQTYTGKNKISYPANVNKTTTSGVTFSVTDGVLSVSGTATGTIAVANLDNYDLSELIGTAPACSVLQTSGTWTSGTIGVRFYDSSNTQVFFQQMRYDGELFNARTLTAETAASIARGQLFIGSTFAGSGVTCRVMLSKSETVETSFEPFVGGQPSPSPDYPQPIQTVTGEQTVTINSTAYPISLGSIELCKLGTYQDYIYKDGEDWKVHKATALETLNGSEDWVQDSSGGYQRFNIIRQNAVAPSGRTAIGLSSHFTSKTTDGIGIFFLASTSSGTIKRFYFYPESSITTVESFESWLNSNKTTLVYPLATPTDTVITDQTLIAQLEAIRTAALGNGANTITNAATGSNLAGDMEISYYGYNPTNRYDKWLWLGLNENYEQIGS